MTAGLKQLRRHATVLVALLWVGFLYAGMRLPSLTEAEQTALAQRFKFTALPLAEIPGATYQSVRKVHPSFERISAWIAAVGAGVALTDVDADGLPNDICLVDPRTDLVSLSPVPGTGPRYAPFALQANSARYDAASMAPMGCVGGDFNEDGLTDLLVYYWGRAPLLFIRTDPGATLNADGFRVQELVPGNERWFSNAATQADLNGDGHADIIVGNYFQDGAHVLDQHGTGTEQLHNTKSKAFNGGKKHLLLWAGVEQGVVRYEEVNDALPDEISHGWSLALAAADLDGDLLPELYLAHDFGPDRLLHNRSQAGHLNFAVLEGERHWLTPKSFVINRDSFKGMGADFGDLNGDGLLDIMVSNITSQFGLMESHFVWQNTGEIQLMQQGVAPFNQASESLGLSRSGWSWDVKLADFDNDGQLEVVQTAGFLKGKTDRWAELQALGTGNDRLMSDPHHWPRFLPGDNVSGYEGNALFARAADGRFYNIAPLLGVDSDAVSRGIATADVDGDGDLDYVVANQWAASSFYRNDCPDCGQSLVLHLLVQGNGDQVLDHPGHHVLKGRTPIGAEVKVSLPDGRVLSGQIDGGNGHSGKRSPDLHFGLGKLDPQTTLAVQIRWRDNRGQIQQHSLRLVPGWHVLQLGESEYPA